MRAWRVAVEDSLGPVGERLGDRGFEVVSVSGRVPPDVVAVVVNGLTGDGDVPRHVPVVDAAGRTPDEVVRDVESKIPPDRR